MLVIGQNRNILLIYKGPYSTHGIILDNLPFLLIQFGQVKNEKILFGQ